MKLPARWTIVCLALAAVRGQAPVETPLPLLTWQSVSGHRLEAAYVRRVDNRVVLRRADGREIEVALDELEEGSRLQAEQLARRSFARSARAIEDAGSFRLRVYPKAVPFTLDLLDAGGEPLDYGPILAEAVVIERRGTQQEKLQRWQAMAEPIRDHSEGGDSLWKARMGDGSVFELRLRRRENALAFTWWLIPVGEPAEGTTARFSLVFPATESLTPHLTAVDSRGAERVFEGRDAAEALRGPWTELRVALPETGRLVRLRPPSPELGAITPHLEPTRTPRPGFRLDTWRRDPFSEREAWFVIEFASP